MKVRLQEEFPLIDLRGRESLDRMIRTCARWSAEKFDPAKMEKRDRDRGGAAHLMQEGDDAVTRMRKGQSFSADVKVAATRRAITSAIMTITRDGSEPTTRHVGQITNKSPNTVKSHFFAAYVTAVASRSIQGLVKEVPSGIVPLKPPLPILLLANRPTDLPKCWHDERLARPNLAIKIAAFQSISST